jgi:hypothetical protein
MASAEEMDGSTVSEMPRGDAVVVVLDSSDACRCLNSLDGDLPRKVTRVPGRLLSSDVDAERAEVGDRLGLSRVQVPCRDDGGTTTPEGEHELRRLRLEEDGGAIVRPANGRVSSSPAAVPARSRHSARPPGDSVGAHVPSVAAYDSSTIVTGPSLTSATSIRVPNTPVATSTPSAASAAQNRR